MRKRQAIWIFKSGRKERLESACDFPTEFFYGFPELKENGWSIGLLEDIDLKMAFPLKPTAYLLNKLARFFGRIPIGLIAGLIKKQVRRKLPVDTTIIATTNNIGLALGRYWVSIGSILGQHWVGIGSILGQHWVGIVSALGRH